MKNKLTIKEFDIIFDSFYNEYITMNNEKPCSFELQKSKIQGNSYSSKSAIFTLMKNYIMKTRVDTSTEIIKEKEEVSKKRGRKEESMSELRDRYDKEGARMKGIHEGHCKRGVEVEIGCILCSDKIREKKEEEEYNMIVNKHTYNEPSQKGGICTGVLLNGCYLLNSYRNGIQEEFSINFNDPLNEFYNQLDYVWHGLTIDVGYVGKGGITIMVIIRDVFKNNDELIMTLDKAGVDWMEITIKDIACYTKKRDDGYYKYVYVRKTSHNLPKKYPGIFHHV